MEIKCICLGPGARSPRCQAEHYKPPKPIRKYFQPRVRKPETPEVRHKRRISAIKRRIRQYGPKWRDAQIMLLEEQIERLQVKLAVFREAGQ